MPPLCANLPIGQLARHVRLRRWFHFGAPSPRSMPIMTVEHLLPGFVLNRDHPCHSAVLAVGSLVGPLPPSLPEFGLILEFSFS